VSSNATQSILGRGLQSFESMVVIVPSCFGGTLAMGDPRTRNATHPIGKNDEGRVFVQGWRGQDRHVARYTLGMSVPNVSKPSTRSILYNLQPGITFRSLLSGTASQSETRKYIMTAAAA
jgi:hypothetical protein